MWCLCVMWICPSCSQFCNMFVIEADCSRVFPSFWLGVQKSFWGSYWPFLFGFFLVAVVKIFQKFVFGQKTQGIDWCICPSLLFFWGECLKSPHLPICGMDSNMHWKCFSMGSQVFDAFSPFNLAWVNLARVWGKSKLMAFPWTTENCPTNLLIYGMVRGRGFPLPGDKP